MNTTTPSPLKDRTGERAMQVAAICDGTVIDHIPSEKLFEVISLLELAKMKASITVGYNLKSHKMGRKSIIKIAGKFFTNEELNRLAVVAPGVSLVIIRDYEIVEKRTVVMPDMLVGMIYCPNPKCITNNEPMRTRFRIADISKGTLRCDYCNRVVERENVKII